MVQRVTELDWSPGDAGEAAGVSERTVFKWLKRSREEGLTGLQDRSSRPRNCPGKTPQHRVDRIVAHRRQKRTAPDIARRLKMPRSTVSEVLKREGMQRLKLLEPKVPVRRYEKKKPGELLHVDTKKLGRIRGVGHRFTGRRQHRNRGIGWEFVHLAIDDHSRVAYVETLPDEKGATAAAFLERAVAWFRERGVRISRVLSDNGSCYISGEFNNACAAAGIRHSYTRPYRPQTNGKAERLVQTMLRESAYARPYPSSARRRQALQRWARYYNERRPHGSLGGKTPFSRMPKSAE
jgi:transposase InsO family protein